MGTNKSFSTETSERYSRALFEVAKEDNELDKIENDVKNFQSIFQKYPEITNKLMKKLNLPCQCYNFGLCNRESLRWS